MNPVTASHYTQKLSEELRRAAATRKLSYVRIAEKLGVHVNTASAWMKRKLWT